MKNITNASKENILNAILNHISKSGTHRITIREIARIANVNSAAISYYFGSKDNLIQEACKSYYDLGSKLFNELREDGLKPREKLKRFFLKYMDHMFNYPGFLKAQTHEWVARSPVRRVLHRLFLTAKNLSFEIKLYRSGTGDKTTTGGPCGMFVLTRRSDEIFSRITGPFLGGRI